MYSEKKIIYYGFETAYGFSHLLESLKGIFYKVIYYKMEISHPETISLFTSFLLGILFCLGGEKIGIAKNERLIYKSKCIKIP